MITAEYNKQKRLRIVANTFLTDETLFKKATIYLLCFMLACLVAGYFVSTDIIPRLPEQLRQKLFAGLFLLAGVIHVAVFSKWVKGVYHGGIAIEWPYTLLLAMVAGVSIFLMFMYTGFANQLLAVSGAGIFLLPALLLQLWKTFESISPKKYPPWFLPSGATQPKQLAILLNSIEVTLQLKIKQYDLERRSFPLTVPSTLPLGIIFQRFILEMGESDLKIQLTDEQGQAFSWSFLIKTYIGNKMLDPKKTLADNRVLSKSAIIIERITPNELNPDH